MLELEQYSVLVTLINSRTYLTCAQVGLAIRRRTMRIIQARLFFIAMRTVRTTAIDIAFILVLYSITTGLN